RVGDSTNSEAAWCRISEWFDSCTHTHATCGWRRLQNRWYPTRLLDVGVPGTETDTVKLIHTATTSPHGPYLTLSHCWGGSVSIRTTRETETSFQSGLPITSLPQTFRDAVQVTRKLKARYLWIDSLCILQDDHDDWTREAPSMDRVYENALCNIAATAAESSQGGLFFNRRPWLASPIVRDGLGAFQLSKADMLEEEIGESPLQQRAWVFQERQISPRVLHFGKNQIFWECGELFANETYPKGLSSCHSPYPLGVAHRVKRHKYGLLYVWKTMVQIFSALDLTFESDKLPGFAGIARRFEHLLGPSYLAGLWPSHSPEFFVIQLAWHVLGPSGRNHDEPYLAPSWSWASAQGSVQFSDFPNPEQADSPGPHEMLLVGTRFLEAHVDAATWDPFGPVKGGYMSKDLSTDTRTWEGMKKILESFTLTISGSLRRSGTVCLCCLSTAGHRGTSTKTARLDIP
ncbi:heterokaryon incompatibility protein-domain-containing protein, partial [Plectosphaerella plurivora]